MKDLFARVLLVFTTSDKKQLVRTLELCDAEIEMLRSRVRKQRIFLTNEERERLLEIGECIGLRVANLMLTVSPRTYKRWVARKENGDKPPSSSAGSGRSTVSV